MSEEIDHEYTTELVCPYCGCKDLNSWELAESRDAHQCVECEKYFSYESHTERYFTSKKVDCLNGAPHDMKPANYLDYPDAMRCKFCRRTEWGKKLGSK